MTCINFSTRLRTLIAASDFHLFFPKKEKKAGEKAIDKSPGQATAEAADDFKKTGRRFYVISLFTPVL